MNLNVSFRANVLGSLSPTRQERLKAAEDRTAMERAAFVAQLREMGLAAPTKSAQSASPVKSASGSEDTSANKATTADNAMGRDAFLQLLVEQMKNQDPMEPMDNSAMLAQLAQFSSLEQMNNLNESFETFSGTIGQLNYVSAGSLIGRSVIGKDEDGTTLKGVVTGVFTEDSQVFLTLDTDDVMLLSEVQGIASAPSS